jgi:hypothetical protein
VTGSYGGEEGFLSRTVVVRAQNLHAWVEADLDGTGFEIFDPTPAAGVPPLLRQYSFASRLFAFGREIEFFYDRRVLGFDAGDQVGAIETARDSLAAAATSLTALRASVREAFTPDALAGLVAAGLAGWLALRLLSRARERHGPATRAYLALRGLAARRGATLAPSTPPAEVARLFAGEVPEAAADARAVVDTYCASAFGGIEPGPDSVRELSERVRRLRKLA